ncbi:hypothetical protein WICPIJ_003899 [Wickerhamomyces pijperi]|uniref:Uncharacterized protein n=1 Tax=Wickerhamomyces pijperi TaxID=599730 RepID=A0A9P8Q6Z7_WICPI|nr:hypothetical protein WICPIJ_003899 [Wickerhamomyces pijperi]
MYINQPLLKKFKGLMLLMIPPVTLLKTSEAIVLAFPNLSHLVKAIELVKVKEMAITTRIKEMNSNFNTAMKANTHQATGAAYSMIQNTLESIGLIYLSGSAVSKTQILPPFSSVSFHQRNPTNNLPLMFLTFQKSAANNKITVMNNRM